MDANNIIIILTCILLMIFLLKILKFSIKKILKLMFNSILGGILIYFINIFSSFHIGLNVVNSIFIGIFGIPGTLLLLAIKIF